MFGKLIKLDSVTVPTVGNAPKITMTPADILASKINSISKVAIPRHMKTLNTAQISAVNGVNGSSLSQLGRAGNLVLSNQGDNVLIGMGAAYALDGALTFGEGSLTDSYCVIAVVDLSADDIPLSSQSNILCMFPDGFDVNPTTFGYMLRYYGQASGNPNKWVCGATSTGGSNGFATIDSPGAGKQVLVADYNNATKRISISVNGGAVSSVIATAQKTMGAKATITLGYAAPSSRSLGQSKVGEVYIFNKSLLGTTFGANQVTAIVAALKTQYGIA